MWSFDHCFCCFAALKADSLESSAASPHTSLQKCCPQAAATTF